MMRTGNDGLGCSWLARAARRAAGFAIAATAVLTSSAALAEAPGGPAAKPALAVAILDLADIPELAPRPPPEARRPAWRTTFGAERVTEPEIKAGGERLAALADVDVVLIQGVQVAARLRRLFPPRAWRLVVSRRVLSTTDPVGFRTVRSDIPPTTAIAVKARNDLRITARLPTVALDQPGADAPSGEAQASATAVRLVARDGRTLWLASVALPASCGTEDPPCAAREVLEGWRRERAPALVGGRIGPRPSGDATAPSADVSSGCAAHTVMSDLPWQRTSVAAPASDRSGGGCISIIRIEG